MANTNLQYYIRKGLFDLLLANTALKTAITQTVSATPYYKLYFHEAPQAIPGTSTDVTLPYIVMDLLPISQMRDTATKLYSFTVQFLCAGATLSDVEGLAGNITTAVEDKETSTTMTSHTVISILRDSQINQGLIDGIWNLVVQYSLIIQAT